MNDHPLIVRRDAAQATLYAFGDRPFAWGERDCGKMLAAHLKALGHKVALAKAGHYDGALGATRALKRLGFASLSAALDSRYPRITPAMAIVGDVLALPSTGPLDAIFISLGNGAALGYLEDHDCAVTVRPTEMVAAWRIDP